MDSAKTHQASVAETFLRSLKRRGVDYVLANAGTDFAPIIEGLVELSATPDATPTFLTIPHENLAVAMAHGYYLVSGKLAAAMVHVTVGTGNTICALMNANRDNVPLLLMAGRTPHTQSGHIASRSLPIHWGQENFDQAGMVREYTKWDYELRAGQPVDQIIGRALEIATSEPRGPVYLTLPREVLADIDTVRMESSSDGIVAQAQPSSEHIETAARWLSEAQWPMIVTSHLGRNVAAVNTLAQLCEQHSIPLAQAAATCINLPASHPMNTGARGVALLEKADVIVVVDSEVPWFPVNFSPAPGVKVVHLGVDPLCARYPIRTFPTQLAIPGDSHASLRQLNQALQSSAMDAAAASTRRKAVDQILSGWRAQITADLEASRGTAPIKYSYLGACVREALPANGLVVTELGVSSDQLALEEPGSLLGVGLGGGLGFGLGASLGAKLGAPERTIISTVGDGSYMFGNPTPFHLVARANGLATLTIVCNNGRWHAVDAATRGVYPEGAAAASSVMPLVELQPTPEFSKVAEASDAFAKRVEDPAELPGAIQDALAEVANGRQALLDVRMELGRRSKG